MIFPLSATLQVGGTLPQCGPCKGQTQSNTRTAGTDATASQANLGRACEEPSGKPFEEGERGDLHETDRTCVSLASVTALKLRQGAATEDLGLGLSSLVSPAEVLQPKPPNVWGPCRNSSSPWCSRREKGIGWALP